MNIYFCRNLYKLVSLVIFFASILSSTDKSLNAQDFFEELQINSSTKTGEDTSVIPNNPFEIVEMIRRNNILNDATNPSDAVDDALKSFNSMEVK
tara:strand:- start:1045 stop:1329 length:285 start_codon:yes stop_codon:yes gene_type:complete